MTDPVQLLTIKEAAELLHVSASYLRNSDCPKVRLPGAKGDGRQVIRFNRADLLAWVASHSVGRVA